MYNDFFKVRDLKSWLETLTEDERKECLCIIGGDSEAVYLDISLKDVPSKIYEFKSLNNRKSKKVLHQGLLERGYERANDYCYLEVGSEEAEDSDTKELYDTIIDLSGVRAEYQTVLELCEHCHRVTAEDLLKKLEGIDLDLPLMYDGVDLKTACFGIGWWKDNPKEEIGNEVVLECGIYNFAIDLPNADRLDLVKEEVPKQHTIKNALVIELWDGGELSDLSIWKYTLLNQTKQ